MFTKKFALFQKSILVIAILLASNLLSTESAKAEAKVIPFWQPCQITKLIPCIDSISILDENNKLIKGELTGRNQNQTNKTDFITYSGQIYEWNFPGIKQTNGNSKVLVDVNYFPLNYPYCWLVNQDLNTCDYSIDQIHVDFTPSWWDGQPPPIHFKDQSSDAMCGTKEKPEICIPGWDLNEKHTYMINLKVSKEFIPALFVGEAKNGKITLKKDQNDDQIISIQAQPIKKAIVWNVPLRPMTLDLQNYSDRSVTILAIYLASNKAGNALWTNSCRSTGVLSISQNGSITSYPTWSNQDDTLQMQLTGTHFQDNGELTQGYFQIRVPLAMAKCLWKVDVSRKISANISATYAGQESNEVIASSATLDGDQYVVSASGFHYSSPTIKVKLDQTDSPQTPAKPSATNLPLTKQNTQNIQITCINGTKQVVISGKSPLCPKGYKIKTKR